MIDGLFGLLRRPVPQSVALVALSVWVGASADCLAQQAIGRPASPFDLPALRSETLAQFQTLLEAKYPGVRSLLLARGNCVAFEYYRKDIGTETRSPVHSITKAARAASGSIGGDD
jgi:hypothetical protein